MQTGRVLHLLDGRVHRDESNGNKGKTGRQVARERVDESVTRDAYASHVTTRGVVDAGCVAQGLA